MEMATVLKFKPARESAEHMIVHKCESVVESSTTCEQLAIAHQYVANAIYCIGLEKYSFNQTQRLRLYGLLQRVLEKENKLLPC